MILKFTGERTNCYVCLARTGGPTSVSISCELHFKVVQVDPSTGEVDPCLFISFISSLKKLFHLILIWCLFLILNSLVGMLRTTYFFSLFVFLSYYLSFSSSLCFTLSLSFYLSLLLSLTLPLSLPLSLISRSTKLFA